MADVYVESLMMKSAFKRDMTFIKLVIFRRVMTIILKYVKTCEISRLNRGTRRNGKNHVVDNFLSSTTINIRQLFVLNIIELFHRPGAKMINKFVLCVRVS